MPRSRTLEPSLAKLLDRSSRPFYAVGADRRIVYCNLALATWLGLDANQIVGNYVEYHSEEVDDDGTARGDTRSLLGLCPPPAALAGEHSTGTVSCIPRDGRLIHRQADFVPLDTPDTQTSTSQASGVIVLLAERDLSPQELQLEIAGERSADELHRAIRRFRRKQGVEYAIESLLGESAPIRKIRAQVKAAAASGANVVIVGRRGTGRAHLARAIHYRANADATSSLIPVDCELISDDGWRRAFDSMRRPTNDSKQRPTLLLINCNALAPEYQAQLYDAIRQNGISARIIATLTTAAINKRFPGQVAKSRDAARSLDDFDGDGAAPDVSLMPRLFGELSTITIHAPRLVERLEDLPILVQCFIEANNRRRDKQVGSIRPDALDLLALHSWPGELDELRDGICAAHRAATSHQITPGDLPPVIHHAAKAASIPPRQAPEPVVLDDLLGSIEKEVVLRALAQARGNKTEAAALLGMTRPRLYRRLVQLGLVSETTTAAAAEEIIFEPEPPGTGA